MSGADVDMLTDLEEKENNVPDVNMSSSSSPRHQRTEASASSTTTGTGANVSRSSSTKERRTKFDDSKHPRADEERERRGRSLIGGGLFGSVKRSRTVEDTRLTGSGVGGSNGEIGRGTIRGHDRQVLKKRNSRGDVDKIER
jgi:hypothetical protein